MELLGLGVGSCQWSCRDWARDRANGVARDWAWDRANGVARDWAWDRANP